MLVILITSLISINSSSLLFRQRSASRMISNDQCSICYEKYNVTDLINPKVKLECNHEFHWKCIDEWKRQGWNCPNCRKQILPEAKGESRGGILVSELENQRDRRIKHLANCIAVFGILLFAFLAFLINYFAG